jgi:hypothetical protein
MSLSKIFGYAKAIVAALSPVAVLVESAITDNQITSGEWVSIVTALVAAVGVLMVPNLRFNSRASGGTMPPAPPYHGDSYPAAPSGGSSGPLE